MARRPSRRPWLGRRCSASRTAWRRLSPNPRESTGNSQAGAFTGVSGVESLGTAAYSTSSSFTWAGFAAHPSGPAPGSTSLIGIARPLSSDLDAAFAPGSNVRTALQGESLMLAETELAQPYANTVFGFETDLTSGKTVDLGIGLSAAELVDMDGGFESLEFTVSTGPNDTTILDVELDGAAAVQAFFADRVLLLPELQGLAGHVAFGVSVTLRSSAPSTSFGAAILFAAVPEPGVLWLFATLAVLLPGWRNWQTRRP